MDHTQQGVDKYNTRGRLEDTISTKGQSSTLHLECEGNDIGSIKERTENYKIH